MYFVFKANSEEIEKLPLLTDLEALADDGKFVRGPRGTNWEEYTTDCTYTKTSGTSVTIGIPGTGVTVSETQTATWTEYNKRCADMEPEHVWHRPDVDMKYLCFFNIHAPAFMFPTKEGRNIVQGHTVGRLHL